MIALLLILAAQPCPPDVSVVACVEHDACVSRTLKPRPASEGVSAAEAALVSRLDAERACGLAARSLAITSSASVRVLRPNVGACLPCPICLPEPAPECATLPVAVVVGVAACGLCGYAGHRNASTP